MQINQTSDLWWKNAVIYCLDVETFQDSNDDGIGDFRGLTRRLDYLADLGVSCLWLMTYYPSPNRDDGYDITDYYAVDPRLGSLGDFVEFIRTAHDRGMRVIADLVVNHTSHQHPWFQSARSDPQSPFRHWYVWRDQVPQDGPSDLVFPDAEQSNWEWDKQAGQLYLHRFYKHQPDLNVGNPEVRDEICRIVGFWLELGLDGFRVDAVPFLLEVDGGSGPGNIAPHDWLRDLRSFVGRRRGDAVMLGEVNLSYEETRRFFGDDGGDELQMCLNFNLNQALALSLARKDTGPLVHSLTSLPSLPDGAAWANFVRNHDEWSRDKLTEAERQEVFRAFGPKPDMQLYGRGLRRRLPTMLEGDLDRLKGAYALALALPGAPVLFYGEEIGLAENLAIPGRMSVRPPMQWTEEANGGFSDAAPEALRRPMVSGRKWGPAAVNAAAQERDPESLLNWMRTLVRRRRSSPEMAFGKMSIPPIATASVLGLRYDWGDRTLLALHNLGPEATTVSLDLDLPKSVRYRDLLGGDDPVRDKQGRLTIALGSYGARWIQVLN